MPYGSLRLLRASDYLQDVDYEMILKGISQGIAGRDLRMLER